MTLNDYANTTGVTKRVAIMVPLSDVLAFAPGLLRRGGMLNIPKASIVALVTACTDNLLALSPNNFPDIYVRDAIAEAVGYVEDDHRTDGPYDEEREILSMAFTEDCLMAAVGMRDNMPPGSQEVVYVSTKNANLFLEAIVRLPYAQHDLVG